MTITSEGLTNFLTRSNGGIIVYLKLLPDILKAISKLFRQRYISFTPFFEAKNRPKMLEYTNLFKNVLVYFSRRCSNAERIRCKRINLNIFGAANKNGLSFCIFMV